MTPLLQSREIKADMQPALALMDRVLRESESISAEYPLIFAEGFPGRAVSLGSDDGARSACSILIRDLVSPMGQIRVGLIGSVVTDPEFRGKGLATKVLEAAEQQLANMGASIAILWADDPRFYFARGYRPIGSEDDFAITHELVKGLPKARNARPVAERDAGAIHALYRQHPWRVERNPRETAALLDCPKMTSLVCERDGKVTAYACLGRGEDLGGVIHEWGGDISDVLSLVRALVEENSTATDITYLIAPSSEEALHARFEAIGLRPSRGILGLGKIIDRERATRDLSDHMQGELELSFDPDAPEAEQVKLVTPNGAAELNDDTLLVLLLSSKGEREEIEDFGAAFGIDVNGLPIEPFLWGLDSI